MVRGDDVGVADVSLAHLEERPAARQQAQGRVDEVARQRVQHHVDTPATSAGPELLFEVEGSRVADVSFVEAHGPQRVPLAAAGGGEHLQPPVPGQLHGGHADATCRGVDEHRLTPLHVGQPAQREVRGGKADREGCGLGVAPVRRHRQHDPRVGGGDGARAFWEEPHHPVADGDTPHAGADLGDYSGGLDAHHGVAGVEPKGDHHVAEIGADGTYRDPDAAGFQRRVGVGNFLEH